MVRTILIPLIIVCAAVAAEVTIDNAGRARDIGISPARHNTGGLASCCHMAVSVKVAWGGIITRRPTSGTPWLDEAGLTRCHGRALIKPLRQAFLGLKSFLVLWLFAALGASSILTVAVAALAILPVTSLTSVFLTRALLPFRLVTILLLTVAVPREALACWKTW
ncbi:hypothetical protein FOXG_20490 [Fusarium oxysporum f. sp. lycopersici 4287]|uniref:Uncharacterized protein n=1 Tax=Fusarium oxysporum f. sp. lycopersici (strain 4287 / CBS 123668 / FGSC 9935 / NRRL 34936) TaxID=426428 RepID=A0A0J9VKQ8_FUSO4|nr:hypothetical protein FOXG_20490 [Fusarium oxysporum f. sp. lycopersici 4287]KNB11296.1 hypothetical protein FOXG_20490 [Fusarium oxysporum f. sp. lycopersici 4287]